MLKELKNGIMSVVPFFIFMTENQSKQSFASIKRTTSWYLKITRKYRGLFLALLLVYGISVVLAEVVTILIYKKIIDQVTELGVNNVSAVWHSFIILLVVSGTFFLLFRLGERLLRIYEVESYGLLTSFIFAEFERHSYDFYANRMTGSLTAQAGRFVGAFNSIVDSFIFTLWWGFIQLVAIVVTVFFFSKIFGFAILGFILALIPIAFPLVKRRMYYDSLEAEAGSKTKGRLADVLSNIFTVKFFASYDNEKKQFGEFVTKELAAQHSAFRAWNTLSVVQNGLIISFRFTLFGISLWLWQKGYITAGTIVLIYSFSASIFSIVWSMTRGISGTLTAYSNAGEMVDILEAKSEITDSPRAGILEVSRGKINFENLSFQYAEGKNVFTNLNIHIQPGEKVGLVGPSGGGKSTITKLLLRFMDPTSGKICIDDQDIKHVTQDSLRRAIGYVPQEPLLFHRTLRENIAYGKVDATDEEVIEAAKKAHAHEFIETLEQGYDTMVGERGVKLSGGQRQRVAIARAILKNAPILVLDEATSALDSISELAIRDAVDKLIKDKTAIIIAHRLSTVEKMDRIIVLGKDGKIIEEGTHQELVAKGGLYSELWSHQTGGFLPEDEDTEEENTKVV